VTFSPGLGGVIGLGPRPRGAGVQMALADIPILRPGPLPVSEPFASSEPIPLRRSRAIAGKTPIRVYLRGASGAVSVTLQSPDGRTTAISRTLR